MAIALYMDQHVPRSITVGLLLRQVDVLTAYEDEASELSDPNCWIGSLRWGVYCSPRMMTCLSRLLSGSKGVSHSAA